MSTSLIALQVNVSNEKGNFSRIVGKVGIVPPNNSIPKLQGYRALYKEETWKNVWSYKLKAIGVDYEAWLKAQELGAEGMIIYCEDTRTTITVRKDTLNNNPKVDLGAGLQVRIKPEQYKTYSDTEPMPFGWTDDVVLIEPKKALQQNMF
jgi:hypothetical protein